jgi:molecular chaperone DnaK
MAERALGEEVDEAVITVPAYFNHAQRAATMEAAQLAGLHCERLLNEPTAAALAYGFKREIDRTLLVFDLGGGTFDVSVLRLSTGVYEILATLGDSYLGGEDFDYRIVDHLAEAFIGAHGVDLREDRTTLHRLKDAAERAKCELSFTDRTTVLIPQIAAGVGLERVLDRTTLEGLVEDYVERAMAVTQQAVSDSGLKISDIDEGRPACLVFGVRLQRCSTRSRAAAFTLKRSSLSGPQSMRPASLTMILPPPCSSM